MKKQAKPVGRFANMRKMAIGGYPDQEIDPATGQPITPKPTWLQNNGDRLATGAQYASATINAFDQKDNYGTQSNLGATASGALNGAATGFKTAGVIGAGVGAVVGGVTGLLGNKSAIRKKNELIAKNTRSQLQQTEAAGEANIAADPSLKYGRMAASYYRFGGTMKGTGPTPPRMTKPIAAVQAKPRLMPNIAEVPGRQISRMAYGGIANALHHNASQLFHNPKPLKTQLHEMGDGGGIHINPANKGKFNATKAATGKTTEELTHSSNPITKKRAIFAQNAAKWNHKADGGTIEPLSSEDVKINGPSHDNGGVKFPSKGVELEGGETVNDGFVFSKKLGFAKPAEKIARALGKAEARPGSPINDATVLALQRKTELLKGQQEATKAAMGIPNEFEQNQLQKKADGGPIEEDNQPPVHRLKQVNITGKKPLVVTNPNDPRLKAYRDSLTVYSENNNMRNKMINSGLFKPKSEITKDWINANQGKARVISIGDPTGPLIKHKDGTMDIAGDIDPKAPQAKFHVIPNIRPQNTEVFTRKEAEGTWNQGSPKWVGESIDNYKEPNQPVIYRKPQPRITPKPAVSPRTNTPIINNLDTAGKDPTKPLSPTNPLMVQKQDGTIGQWGNPPDKPQNTPVFPGAPVVQPSDKAAGLSNTYYPSRGQQTGKAVPTQYPSSRYKFGGKIKQTKNTGGAFTDNTGQQIYADGGFFDDDPKAKKMASTDLSQGPPLVTVTASRLRPGFVDPGVTPTSGMNGPVFPTATVGTPNIELPITSAVPTPQSSSNSKGKFNFGDVVDKVSPFLSNYVNATQRLPLPPNPILNKEISPSLVDYSASRAEAVRATRSADKMAERNLNSGAAVSATKAANLSQQQRSVGQINEAENNTNASIRNSTAAENAQIRAGNTALQNNYNNELVSRTIKGQQLKSQNFANIEEKIQGMARDKKLFDLEDQKAMLGWLQNNDSGAGYDAVRGIFAKHLSPESLKQMDNQIAKQKAERAQDRAETVKMGKLQLDYLKRKGTASNNPYDLIGNGVSVVNSAKDEQADSKTRIKKKE